jgi:hypothetical protein
VSSVLTRGGDVIIIAMFGGGAFLVGDLVLRKIQTTRDRHKLSPLWEGPFIISEVTRPGSYRLKREDGTLVDNSWNIEHLRRFYA